MHCIRALNLEVRRKKTTGTAEPQMKDYFDERPPLFLRPLILEAITLLFPCKWLSKEQPSLQTISLDSRLALKEELHVAAVTFSNTR